MTVNFLRSVLTCFLLGSLIPSVNAQEMRWPAEAPEDWLLAFVDVETTGLQPGYHEMIDIGVVLTDLDGRKVEEIHLLIQPEHPQRVSDGARAVNAFDEQRWREAGALKPRAAVGTLVGFHRAFARDKNVMMVAFNSHFDAAFLDHLFRSSDASWRDIYHYFILDLPSMAWSKGIRGLTGTAIAEELGIEDEPHVAELHTGITGARLNARIYRALLEYRIASD